MRGLKDGGIPESSDEKTISDTQDQSFWGRAREVTGLSEERLLEFLRVSCG